MPTIILATRNAGKVREIVDLLDGLPIQVKSLLDRPELPEIDENGSTFRENALIKAHAVYKLTGIPSLADDSGLEVFALGMRPGVYSARYAGEGASYADNNRKLLYELAGVPGAERMARFRCVAAFVDRSIEHAEEGSCAGRIESAPRGEGGFGYDPLFVPDGYNETFAELPIEVKNGMSHRSMAFRRMVDFLRAHFHL